MWFICNTKENATKIFGRAGPKAGLIVTPPICFYKALLKLNSTPKHNNFYEFNQDFLRKHMQIIQCQDVGLLTERL